MTDPRQQFAYGSAARRAFEVFIADIEPAMRHRMGRNAYSQLREVFTAGFEHGLSYQAETAPEPRVKARPTEGAA